MLRGLCQAKLKATALQILNKIRASSTWRSISLSTNIIGKLIQTDTPELVSSKTHWIRNRHAKRLIGPTPLYDLRKCPRLSTARLYHGDVAKLIMCHISQKCELNVFSKLNLTVLNTHLVILLHFMPLQESPTRRVTREGQWKTPKQNPHEEPTPFWLLARNPGRHQNHVLNHKISSISNFLRQNWPSIKIFILIIF